MHWRQGDLPLYHCASSCAFVVPPSNKGEQGGNNGRQTASRDRAGRPRDARHGRLGWSRVVSDQDERGKGPEPRSRRLHGPRPAHASGGRQAGAGRARRADGPAETAKPASDDPIVALVRQRLAQCRRAPTPAIATTMPASSRSTPSMPASRCGPARGASRPGQQAIAEIRKADDWGLKASAFDLPPLPHGPASPEALAEAEIKLGLAVLKYGRHARGGRVDPLSVHRIFDQKPTIYDPKTLMLAHRRLRARSTPTCATCTPGTRNSSACARRCWRRAPPSRRTQCPPPPGRQRTSSG